MNIKVILLVAFLFGGYANASHFLGPDDYTPMKQYLTPPSATCPTDTIVVEMVNVFVKEGFEALINALNAHEDCGIMKQSLLLYHGVVGKVDNGDYRLFVMQFSDQNGKLIWLIDAFKHDRLHIGGDKIEL
jgi:hypothetical protein